MNQQEKNNSVEKWAKDVNKQFTEEEITIADKYEEMFILLRTRECKLKLQ